VSTHALLRQCCPLRRCCAWARALRCRRRWTMTRATACRRRCLCWLGQILPWSRHAGQSDGCRVCAHACVLCCGRDAIHQCAHPPPPHSIRACGSIHSLHMCGSFPALQVWLDDSRAAFAALTSDKQVREAAAAAAESAAAAAAPDELIEFEHLRGRRAGGAGELEDEVCSTRFAAECCGCMCVYVCVHVCVGEG
jgi:hypothetical protein